MDSFRAEMQKKVGKSYRFFFPQPSLTARVAEIKSQLFISQGNQNLVLVLASFQLFGLMKAVAQKPHGAPPPPAPLEAPLGLLHRDAITLC